MSNALRAALLVTLSAWACARNEGVDPPADRIFFPTGLAVDPHGRFLYVANSNFDIAFNGGTLLAIDLDAVEARLEEEAGAVVDEKEVLVDRSTVALGTFVNDLIVTPDGSRLFASVRGDNSVTYVDVTPDGDRLLRCQERASGDTPTCEGRWVLGRDENDRGLGLANEPHALALFGERLFVTHADDGEVAMFETALDTPELTSVSDRFPPGSTGIAVRPGPSGHPDDFHGYVTSRDSPVVSRFSVVGSSGVQVDRTVRLDFLGSAGVDQRGIAFSADGLEAYVVSRYPESLLVLDTRPDEIGDPVDEFVSAIEVARGPALLAIAPETGSVYVACFDARKIFVVDPELGVVTDIVLTGLGPHTLVFDPTRPLAYLAQFTESTIAVLDVDPGSEHYDQTVLTIGVPDPPEAAQ